MISHEYHTPIKEKLRDLESRYIYEGRVVFDNFMDLNYVRSLFHFVKFECLLEINEQIYARFILELYSQYRVSYSDEGQMFVEFVIQNQFFSYSLEEFAQILDIPSEGACVFTDRWRLDELAYDGQVHRIPHEEEIDVLKYQVLSREIEPTLKPLKEIIRENMENPKLENESYVLYDRVMTHLVAQLEQKPRRDRGTRRGRHSTSSSSAFDQPSLSHLNDDSSSHLNDVEMMGMTVGSRMQVTTSPFVCSLLYQSGP
ncbi:hypothetical protein Tco_0960780 [Tanacetum coccineum]